VAPNALKRPTINPNPRKAGLGAVGATTSRLGARGIGLKTDMPHTTPHMRATTSNAGNALVVPRPGTAAGSIRSRAAARIAKPAVRPGAVIKTDLDPRRHLNQLPAAAGTRAVMPRSLQGIPRGNRSKPALGVGGSKQSEESLVDAHLVLRFETSIIHDDEFRFSI
jgi:hypothetical protein